MSRDFEDDEHKNFIMVPVSRHAGLTEGISDEEPVAVSQGAWQLHAYATITSLCEGHLGFVPDDYLSSIRAETDLTAFELVTAALWERACGGYVIRDPYMLDLALQVDEHVREAHRLENERKEQRL